MEVIILNQLLKIAMIPLEKQIRNNIAIGVEFETGRIINGKKEFGKMINCGNLPNATSKVVETGLLGIKITKIEGVTSKGYPLPFINFAQNYSIQIYCYGSGIEIKTATDYSKQTAVITLYYTKN